MVAAAIQQGLIVPTLDSGALVADMAGLGKYYENDHYGYAPMFGCIVCQETRDYTEDIEQGHEVVAYLVEQLPALELRVLHRANVSLLMRIEEHIRVGQPFASVLAQSGLGHDVAEAQELDEGVALADIGGRASACAKVRGKRLQEQVLGVDLPGRAGLIGLRVHLDVVQDRARHAAQVRGRPDEMVSLLAQVEEVVGLVPECAEHVQLPFAEFFVHGSIS